MLIKFLSSNKFQISLNTLFFMVLLYLYWDEYSFPIVMITSIILILNVLFICNFHRFFLPATDPLKNKEELNVSQRNQIMEDLDREAARRRETKNLTRN